MRLAEGETLLLDLRPHGRALVLPVLVLLVTVGAAGFAAAQVPAGDAQAPLRAGTAVVALLVLLRFALVPALRWSATRFVLTDERIALRRGVLRRHGRDVPLSQVDDVAFSQTLLERLRRSGTLVVSAGDGAPVLVPDLPGVEAVHSAVHRQVDALRQASRPGAPPRR